MWGFLSHRDCIFSSGHVSHDLSCGACFSISYYIEKLNAERHTNEKKLMVAIGKS